jgi:hypothetical protein
VQTLSAPMRGRHGTILKSLSIVSPSNWFRFLVKRPQWFKQLLLGSTTNSQRAEFWNSVRDVKDWQGVFPDIGDTSKHIPFKLHGDKGPYYKKRQLQVFSVSSVFSHHGVSTLSRLALCHLFAIYCLYCVAKK